MKHLRYPTIALFAVFIFLAQGIFAATPQAGPRDSRGTQLGRDPGKPLITACIGGYACQFLGMVDPGALAVGPLIIDSSYFVACTPGACGAPAPFLLTPTFLAGTSVAAGLGGLGGLGAGATAGIAAGAAAAVGVGLGVGLTANKVQTGSQ